MQATTPEDSSFFEEKNELLQVGLYPVAYCAGALLTEPLRQLSWAGRIFKVFAGQKHLSRDKHLLRNGPR